ncbi:MAG: hypothetical protein ACRD96_15620 [Bryobacteraceae bacterium]
MAQEQGFSFHARLFGTASELGSIHRFDPSVSYSLNRYVAIEGGVPFYFVSLSAPSSTPGLANAHGAGLGNAYGAGRLTLPNPILEFSSILTVAAPTGDKDLGLTTDRTTYDWSNHFRRSIGRVTPFAIAGLANTITDTPFFVRPFSSYGTVGHLEGGTEYDLWRIAGVGASAYAVIPAREQRIVSRVV